MQSDPSPPLCLESRLPNGIYEFVFLKNNRQAVDEYLAIMKRYISGEDHLELVGSAARVLIELREPGMPPAAYMANGYRDLLLNYDTPLPSVQVGYIYSGSFLLSMARTFTMLLPVRHQIQRRFFHISERAQAEAWLLAEADT